MSDISINQKFKPIFSDNLADKRYYHIEGDIVSGKSFALSSMTIAKTYSKYKHTIVYLYKNDIDSSGAVYETKDAIHRMNKKEDFVFKNDVFTNKITGSTIHFKKISDEHKINSMLDITTLIVDDFDNSFPFDLFKRIDYRICSKNKPIKIIFAYRNACEINSNFLNYRKNEIEHINISYKENIKNVNLIFY